MKTRSEHASPKQSLPATNRTKRRTGRRANNLFANKFSNKLAKLAALTCALVCALPACSKDPIEIIDPENSEGGDFGRAEILAAVDKFRKDPTSPQTYRVFADEMAALRPQLDNVTNAFADRMLAFLAIEPLSAAAALPADEQLDKLGATVWPFALGPAPKKGERGIAYLNRICGDELASECKFIVPEQRPLFIGAKVLRRFRFRAQETFSLCRECQNDQSFRDVLRRYDELSFPIETLAAERSGEGHPREWPRAEPTASPWDKELVTLEVSRGGALRLSGKEVGDKSWRERLSTNAGEEVGLYLKPDLSVARLRDYLKDLGSLGFRAARLQVRLPEYPYKLSYFPLATKRGRGTKVLTRATDTIQVMTLAAHQATKKAGKPVTLSVF